MRSISSGGVPCGMREWMTTRLVLADGGKSHSWLTPTTSRSSPSAKRISVADGNKETMRIGRLYHKPQTRAAASRPPAVGRMTTREGLHCLPFESLLVQEISAANGVVGGKIVRPTRLNPLGRNTFLQLPNGLRISGQQQKLRRIELIRIKLSQNCRDLQPQPHRPNRSAIGDANGH